MPTVIKPIYNDRDKTIDRHAIIQTLIVKYMQLYRQKYEHTFDYTDKKYKHICSKADRNIDTCSITQKILPHMQIYTERFMQWHTHNYTDINISTHSIYI